VFLRVKVYTSLVVRQIVFLSETSVGLFEQDYHFGPGGKRSPGWARDAKILLARPGSALANASGRVDFRSLSQTQEICYTYSSFTNPVLVKVKLKCFKMHFTVNLRLYHN